MTKFKPVFTSAWSGVNTQCEECNRSIDPDEWFYPLRDIKGVRKRVCSQCFDENNKKKLRDNNKEDGS